MPESTSTTATNTAPITSANPQAGAAVTPPAQAATTTTTPEPQAGDGNNANEPFSLDEAKKLRSESANLRKRLKAYEDAENAQKEAALSDLEKSNKRATEAEAKIKQYQEKLVNAQVKLAAKDKGIIDPDLAALAVQSQLEYDDEGMPSNLEKVLADLIKNKPFLVASGNAQTPASAAQTAQTPNAPSIPAMNPGRTNIQSPVAQPLQGAKRVSLAEAYRLNAQQNQNRR